MSTPRLAVILTSWRRIYRLPDILKDLAEQSHTEFDLYIWNNNHDPGKPDKVDAACKPFENDLRITTIHSRQNLIGRGRMILSRHLRLKHGTQWVVFFDDDQKLPKHTVERLWDEKQPRTCVSAWAWKHSGPAIWPKVDCTPGEFGFHCGSASSITDTELFGYDQYWRMWPKKFWRIGDPWRSFMIQSLGWQIVKSSLPLHMSDASDDQNALTGSPETRVLWDEFSKLFFTPQAGRHGSPLYTGPLP